MKRISDIGRINLLLAEGSALRTGCNRNEWTYKRGERGENREDILVVKCNWHLIVRSKCEWPGLRIYHWEIVCKML